MKVALVLTAAGVGKRMGRDVPKQFVPLGDDKSILYHTFKRFKDSGFIDKYFIVLPKVKFSYWKVQVIEEINQVKKIEFLEGGSSRTLSVKKALDKIPENWIVLIHDGVRPFVSSYFIERLIEKMRNSGGKGVIPLLPLVSSLRMKNTHGYFISIDRSLVFEVQTPQCFLSSKIKMAYSKIGNQEFYDDASVYEYFSEEKLVEVEGLRENIKITTPEDLDYAEFLRLKNFK